MKEDPVARSRIMRAVKGAHTGPEMVVRRLVHSLGYRYRLHRSDLPGTPDLTFVGRHKVIFIDGCFWHGHDCKRGSREPKNNSQYWRTKIRRNVERDANSRAQLKAKGWLILGLWECELKDPKSLRQRLLNFLE